MRCGVLLLLVAGFFVLKPAVSHAQLDPYQQALLAVQRSDWKNAYSLFLQATKDGHAGAFFSLGLLHQMGRGVERDADKAMSYYMQAAEKGFSPAMNNIGLMYKLGVGRPVNYAEALKWFKRAAQEHTMAKFNLAELYERGLGTDKDWARAGQLFLACAKEGAVGCMYKAGRYFEIGRGGFPKDEERALEWYGQAAAQGYNLAARKVRLIEEERERRQKREAAKQGASPPSGAQ